MCMCYVCSKKRCTDEAQKAETLGNSVYSYNTSVHALQIPRIYIVYCCCEDEEALIFFHIIVDKMLRVLDTSSDETSNFLEK